MEDLRQTALGYHIAAPDEIRQVVRHFYEEMDPNYNGHVKFKEFSKYMEAMGCANMASDEFFEELKQPGNDVLYYEDVVTLFYIIHSGRPFCGGSCKKFAKGIYFTCMKCFFDETIDSPFSVCAQCFAAETYEHCHNDFLDPSVHLRYVRTEVLTKRRGSNLNEESTTSTDDAGKWKTSSTASMISENGTEKPKYQRSTSSIPTVLTDRPSATSSQSGKPAEINNSFSSAIVPAVNQQSKQAKMQTAIQFGQLLATMGSIVVASSCTIL